MKNVLVFGGTGHQGSAFVRALAAYNTPNVQYSIHVLARSQGGGGRSAALARLAGVKIVAAAHNYADEPAAAFEAAGFNKGEVDVVFNVQGYMSDEKDEAQGKGIVDAAVEYGVKHFVYASAAHDDTREVGNDGLDAKRRVEAHLKATALTYTILRPTDFMDNWLPTEGFVMKCYRTILLRHTFKRDPSTKLYMVSTRDVGRAGARAVHEPEAYGNKVLMLAGDHRNMREVQEIYQSVMVEKVNETFGLVAALGKWADPTARKLTDYYNSEAYAALADPGNTREVLPDADDFKAFLERFKREQQQVAE